ncbi:MAG: 16S rRNA (uracil(1498)-N(3))-methyltransferase [Magnetococcales bacterium]|nr:16S rRNA (uracil(1498)-N(3))-methyltransferase [Magnetococcales bacterium]MBF0157142.1 16S rRNA (uracil(1498)-N(3))-methyltransferase [Magnetococcales bacterium]
MIPRLFFAEELATGRRLVLAKATLHYLTRVMRLPPGSAVRLFDGRGGEWEAVMERQESGWSLLIGDHHPPLPEAPLRITLVQGLPKGGGLDWVVQKGVELGITALVPLVCRRGVSRPIAARADHQGERWRKIAIEAAEQCGRDRLPLLHPPTTWEKLAALLPPGPRFLFWEEAAIGANLGRFSGESPTGEVTLLIGPEGGLAEEEVIHARDHLGFVIARLGPRILRTETAALAAIAAVQTLWGDWR